MAFTASICSGTITVGGGVLKALSGSVTLNKEEIEVTTFTASTLAYPEQVAGGKVWAEFDVTFAHDGSLGMFDPASAAAACAFVVGGDTVSFSGMVNKLTITKSEAGVVQGSCSGKSSGTVTWS